MLSGRPFKKTLVSIQKIDQKSLVFKFEDLLDLDASKLKDLKSFSEHVQAMSRTIGSRVLVRGFKMVADRIL